MAKFRLKSSSVHLGGVVYKAGKEPIIFDTNGKHKGLKVEVIAAAEAGFLVEIKDSKAEEKAKNNQILTTTKTII